MIEKVRKKSMDLTSVASLDNIILLYLYTPEK